MPFYNNIDRISAACCLPVKAVVKFIDAIRAKKTSQDPEDILRSTTEVKIMESSSTELLQNMHYRPMLVLFFTEGTYVVFVI